jgi:very-short-patch-repair endonuclease
LATGIFARWQARLAGCSDKELRAAIRQGRIQRVDIGVYARSDRQSDSNDPARLAIARMGPLAALAHTTAAQALGIELVEPSRLVHICVPRGRRRDHGEDVRVQGRRTESTLAWPESMQLPTTSPADTVLDLAALPLGQAVAAADSALRRRLVEPGELVLAAARRPTWSSRSGVDALLRAIDPRSGSVPESVLRVELAEAGLPRPVSQFVVVIADRRYVLDFAWPHQRLVVEVDGFSVHGTPQALNADLVRQNALVTAGWVVLRFTAWDVLHRPQHVVRVVADALTGCLGLGA